MKRRLGGYVKEDKTQNMGAQTENTENQGAKMRRDRKNEQDKT